ncbi:MAG: hypothetical protein J7K75_12845, partial [Desulfuromonas sp.]|nr:hypothetical protein [Desulfuromonas sp.]
NKVFEGAATHYVSIVNEFFEIIVGFLPFAKWNRTLKSSYRDKEADFCFLFGGLQKGCRLPGRVPDFFRHCCHWALSCGKSL